MSGEVVSDAGACPACGEPPAGASARFCEACGTALPSAFSGWRCDSCRAEVADDGYCSRCGVRALEPVTVERGDGCAYATHRGLRRRRNEDAGAVATTREGWPVLVVADGVSTSPNPHLAAAGAVRGATRALAGRPFDGGDDLARAISAADQAARDVPSGGDPEWPADAAHPACTIVVAVRAADAVHVANVGDARAYLLRGAAGRWAATELSTDDSVAALAVRQGADPEAAQALPTGHAITAWLGGDAPGQAPHLAEHPVARSDLVLACSDGLWKYAPDEAAMSHLAQTVLPPPLPVPPGRPRAGEPDLAAWSRRLVAWAIEQGGSDNICVALGIGAAVAGPDPVDGADTGSSDQEEEPA